MKEVPHGLEVGRGSRVDVADSAFVGDPGQPVCLARGDELKRVGGVDDLLDGEPVLRNRNQRDETDDSQSGRERSDSSGKRHDSISIPSRAIACIRANPTGEENETRTARQAEEKYSPRTDCAALLAPGCSGRLSPSINGGGGALQALWEFSF